jgi:hypothetical protein
MRNRFIGRGSRAVLASPVFVLGAWLVFAIGAQPANAPSRWESEIAAFEAADRANPPPTGAILFVGSSSIRLWKTLSEGFPDHTVIRRGFGGSLIAESTAFADRIIVPYRPKMIFLYAGDNDVAAGKSPQMVCI